MKYNFFREEYHFAFAEVNWKVLFKQKFVKLEMFQNEWNYEYGK